LKAEQGGLEKKKIPDGILLIHAIVAQLWSIRSSSRSKLRDLHMQVRRVRKLPN